MLLFALFATLGFVLVLVPPLVPSIESFTRFIAGVSAKIIRIAGGHVLVADYTLTCPDNGFSMIVVYGCNGINVIVLLWSALLAWPAAGWTDKLKGMLLGALIVQSANTLRIVSLFYLGQRNRVMFEVMHLYVWEILIMLVGLSVFALWIRRTAGTVVANPAK